MMKLAILLTFLFALQSEAASVAGVNVVVPPDCEPQKDTGALVGRLPTNSAGAKIFKSTAPPPPADEREEVHYREFLASFNKSSLTGFYRAPTETEPKDEFPTDVIGVIDRSGEFVPTGKPTTNNRRLRTEEVDDEDEDSLEPVPDDEIDADGHSLLQQARGLNVFLPDTRAEVNENAYPYRTVGKWRGCTATLVYAPGIVVTNAHCLKYKNDGTMDPSMWNTEFFAGFNNGAFLGKSKPKAIWYDKDDDYAVLKLWTNLDASLGRMGVWWRGEGFFSSDRTLNMISYSGDHCTSNSNCRQKLSTGKSRGTEWIGNNVRHDLDAKRGSSGSAMFNYYNGVPVMDALNFAEYRYGDVSLTVSGGYDSDYANLAKPAGVWKAGYDKIKNF